MPRPSPILTALAGLTLAASGGRAGAQAPADGVTAQGNVISYPAAFFAPLRPDTALDMINRLPGFTLDDGSAVRGFGGAAGNVLIDGQRPTSKTDDLVSILRRLPASQVARIDLIRGATPGIDMQGKTLVANVVLRKAGGFSGAAVLGRYTVRQGYRDPDAQVQGAWRKDGRSIEGSLYAFEGHLNTEGNGPHEIRDGSGTLLDRSQTRNSEPNWEYKATLAGEMPIAGGRFSANLTLDAQPQKLTSIDRFDIAGRQEEHDRQIQNVGELGLHYARDLSGRLTLEAVGLQRMSHADLHSDFRTMAQDQAFRLDNKQSESVGRIVLRWQPSTRLTAEGGGEYADNSLDAVTRFSIDGTPVAVPAADVRVHEGRAEAFGTLTWRPATAFSVEAGLRVETSGLASRGDVVASRRLAFAKPRLVASWSPDAEDQIRLRVEREVGQLDFNQFVATASLNTTGVVAGNPNLLPQQDWAFETAYERHFWRDGIVSLTLRRLFLSDVIDRAPVFAPSGVFDAPGNIGSGAETDVAATFSLPLGKLRLKGFTLRGTGTWRDSRVTDPTTGAKRLISGQHPVDAELHLTDEIPRWKLNWGFEIFFDARERFFRFDEIDTNRIGGNADVYVDYKPRPDLVFRVQVYTLNRYEADRAVFAGPRGIAPLQSLDIQKRTFGPLVFTRIRKTF
ncbi:MAG TPA: TonB-dependent receptor [Allosphingosinicella sp.]|nr:TonB-dependent receptor [Allosphingosinicella sp.]